MTEEAMRLRFKGDALVAAAAIASFTSHLHWLAALRLLRVRLWNRPPGEPYRWETRQHELNYLHGIASVALVGTAVAVLVACAIAAYRQRRWGKIAVIPALLWSMLVAFAYATANASTL
jgi:hypothetical protein